MCAQTHGINIVSHVYFITRAVFNRPFFFALDRLCATCVYIIRTDRAKCEKDRVCTHTQTTNRPPNRRFFF